MYTRYLVFIFLVRYKPILQNGLLTNTRMITQFPSAYFCKVMWLKLAIEQARSFIEHRRSNFAITVAALSCTTWRWQQYQKQYARGCDEYLHCGKRCVMCRAHTYIHAAYMALIYMCGYGSPSCIVMHSTKQTRVYPRAGQKLILQHTVITWHKYHINADGGGIYYEIYGLTIPSRQSYLSRNFSLSELILEELESILTDCGQMVSMLFQVAWRHKAID